MRSGATRTTIALSIAIGCSLACTRRPSTSPAGDVESAGGATLEPSAPDGKSTPADPQRGSAYVGARTTVGPGFPSDGPWVSFYGRAAQMGDLARVARTYRIVNIDADPGAANFTNAQLAELRAGGKNRVLSYMNIGSCERFRTYWSTAPRGLLPCGQNPAAHRGAYAGYPDEVWMDLGNADYQSLILEHVAPRLAARVDGFYLDNLEIVEHSSTAANGPCPPACRQGGLDLVRRLREKFPNHLIVMQNATSDATRLGKTGGIPFPLLLDGIAHEEVYAPTHDDSAEAELDAWSAMGLSTRSRRRFWIGVEDYVGSCENHRAARAAAARARARGFAPYASDESGGQKVVCFWP